MISNSAMKSSKEDREEQPGRHPLPRAGRRSSSAGSDRLALGKGHTGPLAGAQIRGVNRSDLGDLIGREGPAHHGAGHSRLALAPRPDSVKH